MSRMMFVKGAARRTLIEYFRKTSLNGFGLLYFIRKRRIQRLFWFAFITFGILFAGLSVLAMVLQYLNHPIMTSLSEDIFIEENVRFPALTICSGYKLSRRKVSNYADELSNAKGQSKDYWLRQLTLLEGYFDSFAISPQDGRNLQNALNSTNLAKELQKLSPSCDTLILHCEVNDLNRNCSDIFIVKNTMQGFCCGLQHENLTGELTITLDSSQEDAFAMPQNVDGFTLHMPNWLGRLSIQPGELANIELQIYELQANPQLRDYNLDERRCYFHDEGINQADCLTQCRLKAYIINCQCMPPFPFSADSTVNSTHKYCNLTHIDCLQLVDFNWSPNECVRCLPLCHGLFHRMVKNVYGYMHPWRSRISFYYTNKNIPIYQQNELYNWYQMLSNIGGVLSICIGCSFISGFELLYFLSYRLWLNFRNI
ncbi:uncharacterized protein Dwil_GK19159 [Drosophila willistoni]|uniref:pickpocket protein 11 n=1 Tax=Drosophila willistoni TaxID=7260 RepID=UPI000732B806|nr:pickpocket protein 11 [Drosophila willistoni]EDW79520.2 uncharacterized protein Dwil_GK19159 [Drosophila willistoni]